MAKDESSSMSAETPPEVAPVEYGVPPPAESRLVRFFVVLGQGVLWAVVLGGLAFLYGLYDVVTGTTVIISLFVLAAASIFLIVLFSHYRRSAALVNYELGVSALWIGYFMGSVSLTSFVDVAWFSLFFLCWLFSTAFGGLLVASPLYEPRMDSATARRLRICAFVMLVVASGLLTCGFVPRLLFENRPVTAFCALRTSSLQDVAFSPDGNTLATIGGNSGEQRAAKLWDTSTGTRKRVFVGEQGKGDPEYAAVQFVRDPLALAVAYSSFDFEASNLVVRVWDITSGQVQHSFQWDDHCWKVVFSDDGNAFVYCNTEGHVRVFDLQVGRLTVELNNNTNVRCIAVTPACDLLACATNDQKVEIWDVVNAKQERVVNAGHTVSSLSLSSDGRLLACGDENGCVAMIDVNGMRDTTTIPCFDDGPVDTVAFSPNGTMLVCGGGKQGLTRVVDMNQWKVVATLRTWGGWATTCLAFSPDGKRLATGDASGRVAIWDMMSLKREP